jgi:predicted MFS family arabinose efflux permease
MTTRRAWLLVVFLGVALFLNNCDRHTVFSLFPVLRSELHFTDTQLGLTGSIFLWVYALCNPISGQIGDRYSKRKLVAWSLFLWSGVTALTGLSTSPGILLACRGMLGVTESLFMPSAMALLASVHGPRTRSLAANVFGIGEYAGVAVGGWFGSFVAQEFHWRWVFFGLGLFGMLYTIPYLAFLKNVSETRPPKVTSVAPRLSIAVLIKVPTYRFIGSVFPICFCVFWLLYTWLPLFLYEKFSLTLAQAGFTATVYLQSANLVGSLSGAALADWLYSRTKAARLWVSVLGFFLSAPCLYLIGNSASLSLTIAAAVGFGLFGGMFIGNITIASFDVVPAHTRASAYGCLNLTGSLVTGFASLLEGKLKESVGIANMMSFAAIACLTAGALIVICIYSCFHRDHQRVAAENMGIYANAP